MLTLLIHVLHSIWVSIFYKVQVVFFLISTKNNAIHSVIIDKTSFNAMQEMVSTSATLVVVGILAIHGYHQTKDMVWQCG